MTTIVLTIIGIALTVMFVLGLIVAVVAAVVMIRRRSANSQVQFMDPHEWRKVREGLNQWHAESKTAEATEHLRSLLQDE